MSCVLYCGGGVAGVVVMCCSVFGCFCASDHSLNFCICCVGGVAGVVGMCCWVLSCCSGSAAVCVMGSAAAWGCCL